jgi:DNA repair exonuclease SbcCD ATPase subunit
MVQTDISQLASECTEWRQILRNYREEFQDCRKALQQACRKTLSKDQLQEVEHFDNQFHIQLINIHDLKQEIKGHEKRINVESANSENVTEESLSQHEQLLDQFISLESTLQELREEFRTFINGAAS